MKPIRWITLAAILFLLGDCAAAHAQALPKATLTFTTPATDDQWISTAYRPAKIKITLKDAKNSSEPIIEIFPNVVSGENTVDLTEQLSTLPPGEYDAHLKLRNSRSGGKYSTPVRFTVPLTGSQALQPVAKPGRPLRAQNVKANVVLPPPPPPAVTTSLFGPNDRPAVEQNSEANAYELGVRFTSSVPAKVRAIRFWAGSANRGPHEVSLWDASSRARLAREPVSELGPPGWQFQTLLVPVDIQANKAYVASYWCPVGRYASTVDGFKNARTQGVLTAPASTATEGNGVYNAGSKGFPATSYRNSNYWVDVVVEVLTAEAPSPTLSRFLAWDTPLRNEDGSDLKDLFGYRVEWGNAAGLFPHEEVLGLVNEWPLTLLPGQYWVRVRARDTHGNVSTPSPAHEILVQ